jgi:ABC-type sugar transport system substrate-binding protein
MAGRLLRWRLLHLMAFCVAMAIVAAGCGSSSSSSSSLTPAASTSTAAGSGSGSATTVAQKVVQDASTSAAFGPSSGELTPSDISPATDAAVAAGVTPFKAGEGKGRKVIVLGCASISPTCQHQDALDVAMLNLLGFSATGEPAGNDYLPVSQQRVMTQAIALKPYAIITNGISGAALAPQLATAKQQGIFTVSVLTNPASGGGYDQYITGGYNLGTAVLASKMVVDSGPKANVFWYNAGQFPFLAVPEGISFLKQICPGCTVNTQQITAATVVNPVSIAGATTSVISSHPGLNAITWAGDSPMSSVKQAIDTSNNPKVLTYVESFNAATMQFLKAGDMPAMIGQPVLWSAAQAVNAIAAHTLGNAPVPADQIKIGAMMMTPGEIPSGAATEYAVDKWALSHFDFLAPYSKAWGVDLESAIK